METRKTALQEAARAFETERASLQSRIETLERDISEAASKSTNALQKHDSVVEDRDHLRTQLSAKEAECAKLLAQVKQQAASLSEGKKSSEQKDAKLSQLAGKLSETEATLSQSVPVATLKEVQSELQRAFGEKLALETKLAALREQLDAKQSDLRKLETEVEARNAMMSLRCDVVVQCDTLSDFVATLQSELATRRTEAERRACELANLRSESHAQCAALRERIAVLEEGLAGPVQRCAEPHSTAEKCMQLENALRVSDAAAAASRHQCAVALLELSRARCALEMSVPAALYISTVGQLEDRVGSLEGEVSRLSPERHAAKSPSPSDKLSPSYRIPKHATCISARPRFSEEPNLLQSAPVELTTSNNRSPSNTSQPLRTVESALPGFKVTNARVLSPPPRPIFSTSKNAPNASNAPNAPPVSSNQRCAPRAAEKAPRVQKSGPLHGDQASQWARWILDTSSTTSSTAQAATATNRRQERGVARVPLADDVRVRVPRR